MMSMRQIVKKAHRVGNSFVITIDPTLVRKFDIDDMTFLSQEATDDGIIMRIRRLQP